MLDHIHQAVWVQVWLCSCDSHTVFVSIFIISSEIPVLQFYMLNAYVYWELILKSGSYCWWGGGDNGTDRPVRMRKIISLCNENYYFLFLITALGKWMSVRFRKTVWCVCIVADILLYPKGHCKEWEDESCMQNLLITAVIPSVLVGGT